MRRKLFTVILPCLNEERTVSKCVKAIKKSLDKSKYKEAYEILICDNNSTDKSHAIYKKHRLNFLIEKRTGYGYAVMAGIKAAKTKYVVVLDADMSYKTDDIPKMVEELKVGHDLIVGNRFLGEIHKKAMPLSHKVGSRILTEYANFLFGINVHDHHCGLRAFDRKKVLDSGIKTREFEFDTEMIIRAKLKDLSIKEIATDLFKDGRNRKPHLKTFRDGFKCLRLINQIKLAK